ncbi:MAG: nucleoside recognition domain-containing protein [Halomonadaceae bacterium]|uniref:Nucleoside transporter/FeoB GTPase Gate domain-containing protein n=1 Tax=Halomonas colorata TaxID=2742615 RepID=A0ABR9FTW3_9GAMM|nr:nucleoside recognition domain-containing protein [Halomonas colorata]MBE0462059.1 hypothetical protein [Halomonas colorata]
MQHQNYRIVDWARSISHQSWQVYVRLLKILVPALVVVKILQQLGLVQWIGGALAPLMGLLGLPDFMGLVWAAALMTNLYTAIAIFYQTVGDTPLSVAQISVMGSLLLIGHSLPVEGAVAKYAGVSWRATLLLRVGGALLFAWLVHVFCRYANVLQGPASLGWRPSTTVEPDILVWTVSQLQTLAAIWVVIIALVALLDVLKRWGVERWIHRGLNPLLKLLGIGPQAASITVIGFTLGLSYGAGLLIRDVKNGILSKRDSVLALCFLSLCHSVIEDTLLFVMLGADIFIILAARLGFAVVLVMIIARWRP